MDTQTAKKKNPTRADAKRIFNHALKAASSYDAVLKNITLTKTGLLKTPGQSYDLSRYKNIWMVGGGKAACSMAKAVEEVLGPRLTRGVVVTKYGHALKLKKTEVFEAGHPIPDASGISAAKKVIKVVDAAGRRDLLICLISGGASALLPSPVEGITLKDKKAITRLLINCGADIEEINVVRKHLSGLKGGWLAERACPADVLSLIISDVVGNDPSVIASGPTAPDESTFEDCLEVVQKYGLAGRIPKPVLKRLSEKLPGTETPKPNEPFFKKVNNVIIASNQDALRAAKEKAGELGYKSLILTSSLSGSTRDAALFLTSIIREVKESANPFPTPLCILLGGETTLELKGRGHTGRGRGGRCQEFALSSAIELDGIKKVVLLCADTDGRDGTTEAAGAFADGRTVDRAYAKGLEPKSHLLDNDSHGFFKAMGDLLITGPTRTNVMDMVVALIG